KEGPARAAARGTFGAGDHSASSRPRAERASCTRPPRARPARGRSSRGRRLYGDVNGETVPLNSPPLPGDEAPGCVHRPARPRAQRPSPGVGTPGPASPVGDVRATVNICALPTSEEVLEPEHELVGRIPEAVGSSRLLGRGRDDGARRAARFVPEWGDSGGNAARRQGASPSAGETDRRTRSRYARCRAAAVAWTRGRPR